MKHTIAATIAFTLFISGSAWATEGYMCSTYYENVKRKEKNIKSFGEDLSQLAKKKLKEDLEFDTKQCISECEGEKFKYCNEIANWILKI